MRKSGRNDRSNYNWRKVLETVVSHLSLLSAPIYFTPPPPPSEPKALFWNESAKHQTLDTREIKDTWVKGKNPRVYSLPFCLLLPLWSGASHHITAVVVRQSLCESLKTTTDKRTKNFVIICYAIEHEHDGPSQECSAHSSTYARPRKGLAIATITQISLVYE